MYARSIIDMNLASFQDAMGMRLMHYDFDFIRNVVEDLEKLPTEKDKWGRPIYGDNGPFSRPLTTAEWEFINNERIVNKFDYLHFFENYCHALIVKPGDSRDQRVEPIKNLLESQRVLHNLMAEREELIYQEMLEGMPIDGILIAMNKARQLGATQYGRGASMHRVLFWDDTPAVAASVDDEMVHTLYSRDKVIFDNLPWWLKPSVEYDVKDAHLSFGGLQSSVTYFQANQKGGLGTGKTLSTVHLTEVGLWEAQAGLESVKRIRFDLLPTIPQSSKTLVFFESTANGRNNYWHRFVMDAWEGKSRFVAYFCPFYAEPGKYKRRPPEGWNPADHTKSMIEQVERTSPSYMGYTVRLSAEQAYYWESEYDSAKRNGELGSFLANYPATLEESFQHSGSKAFSLDSIQHIRSTVRAGMPYELIG
jgi:hypothetical protein